MATRYRLATPGDRVIAVEAPLSPEEVRARKRDRSTLTPYKYSQAHRITFRPVRITFEGRQHDIQLNYCVNPFCAWYGLPQGPLVKVKGGHEERYRIGGGEREKLSSDEASIEDEDEFTERVMAKVKKPRTVPQVRPELAIEDEVTEAESEDGTSDSLTDTKKNSSRYWKGYRCNDEWVPDGHVFAEEKFTPVSNWSLADEIARLATHDSLVPDKENYEFHREVDGRPCAVRWDTPLDRPDLFLKKGKSKASSQRWQCRECGKITHVLPSSHDAPSYHQQRNEVLPRFARLVLSRTPITRVCEVLGIGRGTYYDKLGDLYTRCLEFQRKHERIPLSEKTFDRLWVCSDAMIYSLNNIRMRNKGGQRYKDVEPRRLATSIVATADMDSGFVFRCDLGYDWDVSLLDVVNSTLFYQDDCLESFSRKYGRLRRMSAYFSPALADELPSMISIEPETLAALKHDFERRLLYHGGMHVSDTYTSMAHFWLLKHRLNVREWYLVSDDSRGLEMAILRTFADEVKYKNAHYFAFTVPNMPTKGAYAKSKNARKQLRVWGKHHGRGDRPLDEVALAKLAYDLRHDPIYDFITDNGRACRFLKPQYMREHPLPHINEGIRWVTCKTDMSDLKAEEQAAYLLRVDGSAVDRFFEVARRSINPLERPLTNQRGKSYIYANTNPYYAHMALTILRTFYNFCVPSPSKIPKPREGSKPKETPAMRLGIADAPFYWEDIIYYR